MLSHAPELHSSHPSATPPILIVNRCLKEEIPSDRTGPVAAPLRHADSDSLHTNEEASPQTIHLAQSLWDVAHHLHNSSFLLKAQKKKPSLNELIQKAPAHLSLAYAEYCSLISTQGPAIVAALYSQCQKVFLFHLVHHEYGICLMYKNVLSKEEAWAYKLRSEFLNHGEMLLSNIKLLQRPNAPILIANDPDHPVSAISNQSLRQGCGAAEIFLGFLRATAIDGDPMLINRTRSLIPFFREAVQGLPYEENFLKSADKIDAALSNATCPTKPSETARHSF